MPCYNTSCCIPTAGAAPATFASAVQFFAAAQYLATEGIYPQAEVKDCAKFDFIIVGAGSSGCVLANRLSEVKHWNILLIEAGGDPPIEANIPGLHPSLLRSQYDWSFKTVNDGVIDKAYRNGSIAWPRGKMIGGSSNINGMVYMKGNDQDYQRWYDAGNKEWSVKEVCRCFRKAESFQDVNLNKYPFINNHYGHNGLLFINTFNITYRKNTEQVLSALNEIGLTTVLDLNAANSFGSGIARATASDGERNSISKAYLRPITDRKNLKIMKNALVTKILINSSRKAYGVRVLSDCRKFKIYATKEVIISAGTINSPQLLMLSGVGPRKHLNMKNVKTVVNLPMVGQNLLEHVILPLSIYADEISELVEADTSFDVFRYFHDRTGYLAQPDIPDIVAFFSLDLKAKFPDFQVFLVKFKNNSPDLEFVYQYEEDVIKSLIDLNKNYTLYNFYITLLHPHSSGNITLCSNDPTKPPIIYPGYLRDQRDLERLISGIEVILPVLNTTYFRSIKGFLGRIKWPACNKFDLNSRDYWKCICINLVGSAYHPVGTCKMGSDANDSVVSSRLIVHGVSNLRVIDASVMPNHVSGNTNGPCVMIGERGAELIKEDYNI